MRKATLILIAIIYVASVVVVSLFGLEAIVYTDIVPVTHIEIVNETKGNTIVEDVASGKKKIRNVFTEPGDINNIEKEGGTVLQLEHRVFPDNATNKEIRYDFAREKYPQVHMHSIDGRETGAIVFTAPAT
jgi:hypothetical protein